MVVKFWLGPPEILILTSSILEIKKPSEKRAFFNSLNFNKVQKN
jgi:hypothetical protein